MAGNQPLGQLRRHDRLARELAERIAEEFGTDSFTLREMVDALNPLTRHDEVTDTISIRRYGQSHLNRLVDDGTLEFNPRSRRYQLNIVKTYTPQLPEEGEDNMTA